MKIVHLIESEKCCSGVIGSLSDDSESSAEQNHHTMYCVWRSHNRSILFHYLNYRTKKKEERIKKELTKYVKSLTQAETGHLKMFKMHSHLMRLHLDFTQAISRSRSSSLLLDRISHKLER